VIARKAKQQYHNHSSRSHHNSRDNLSSTRSHRKKRPICTFCKSNGESANVFTSHGKRKSFTNKKYFFVLVLRNINNEIECPILMSYICPKCGATGKSAHTIKYCPALSENERVALPTVKLFKEGRTSSGNKNLFKK
jgi:protein nanos 1